MRKKEKTPTVKGGTIAIRTPTRKEFFENLKKAAQPSNARSAKKKRPK